MGWYLDIRRNMERRGTSNLHSMRYILARHDILSSVNFFCTLPSFVIPERDATSNLKLPLHHSILTKVSSIFF
jgi:hypothetical protein